ncbi:MAG: puromycin-sensitive aminopeptidase [Patescibacteria group bacterium]|nr:puromycin-sensitive aminopeptidase [Patescibacteria group bacterium]
MARLNRICQQFRPEHYNLHLNVSDDLRDLSGELEVKGVRRSKPSYRITLHQSGLRVSSAKLYRLSKESKQEEIEVTRIVNHNKLEELRLHTSQKIESGEYLIRLSYKAKALEKTTNGVYISTWHNQEDQLGEVLATQFQPHYARSLLPCIDEPEAKATFNLSLSVSKYLSTKYAFLFNTTIEKEQECTEDNTKTLTFEPTPKMSTYLLALVIGNLESVTAKTSSNIPISIYSTPNKIKQTSFALEYSLKIFDLLEEYFQIKYPLQKCDLVAVPDFDSGGMENWGLITFREDLLLFDEGLSTLADKQAVALTIAHEIAHQWFGNLVTMKWWDELWLNEGFANFMEYFIVGKLNPEWNIFEDYLITEKNTAIRLDSLPSSRPIIKKVTSPHHAVEVFDEIAYQKSGSLIRMIYSTIGEEAFRKGLTAYFTEFKFGSATSEDLVGSWQSFSKSNIQQLIGSWLHEPGLPILSISLGKRDDIIEISQSRFLSEKATKKQIEADITAKLSHKPNLKRLQRGFYENNIRRSLGASNDQTWQIPIDFVTPQRLVRSEALKPFILKKQHHKIQLPKGTPLPIKLNGRGKGFYITQYSTEFLAQISRAIQNDELGNLDILNILSDFMALDKLGQFKSGSSSILDIISSCKNSTNANFWSLTGSYLAYIHQQLKQTDQERLLESFTRQLIQPALKKLNMDSVSKEEPNTTAARFEILSLAVMAKEPSVSKHLSDMYYINSDNLTKIPSEQRLLSLYSVAKQGLKKDYAHILGIYSDCHEDVGLREDLMYALTSFEKEEFALSNIALIKDEELMRSQDILSWISLILSSSKCSKDQLLKWLIKEDGWQWLAEILSPTHLSYSVRVFASSAYTQKDLNYLVRFFNDLENEELTKSTQEAKEIAKSRIDWNKKELPKVIQYLTTIKSIKSV